MPRKAAAPVLEQFDDAAGQLCYRFTLPGAPRTKKNHGKVVQRGRRKFHVPSDAYMEWQQGCRAHVMQHGTLALGLELPVACNAQFYRDRLNGDAVGYYQGLADVLQYCEVLFDDVQIAHWDGSRLLKDAANPRTVVTLTVLKSND